MMEENPVAVVHTKALDQITQIIDAAKNHNIPQLQEYLDTFSFEGCKAADIQEPSLGYTPLHAAIASCAPQQTIVQGDTEVGTKAYDTVKVLFENGAIWNQLDRNGETPGCIAYRLDLHDLYQLLVDAGVRAEMLLNRLDEYEEIEDLDTDEEVAEPENDEAPELVDIAQTTPAPTEAQGDDKVESAAYLSSTLSLSDGKLLDDAQNGVMMKWESGIMAKSADSLLVNPGLKIINIGFGMGIIDSYIQSHPNKPAEHHIVEAHPDVLKDMKEKGWFDKPGVFVHPGKWQDVLPNLVNEGHTFDAMYFDTFAESYHDFKDFFSEHVIGLLDQSGRWSYFNGMGADRQISYDVYQKIVEIDLMEAGFDVEWTDVDLPDLGAEWKDVKRKYWDVAQYRLPVCKFMD
jgi:type IV protein arginine methyltransferase